MTERGLIPCPGGRSRIGRRSAIKALPIRVIEELLDADDDLFCPGGGHLWKREAGFDRPMTAYVSGVYRYALVPLAGGPSVATEAQLGGVYSDPTGTGARTPEGHFCWAVDAHLAVARAGIAWDGRGPVPDLQLPAWAERPVLRPGQARTPTQLTRLSHAFPERRLRPFVRYLQAVVDPLSNPHRVVPVSLDVHLPPERWLDGEWQDMGSGEALTLTSAERPAPGQVRIRTIREVLFTWRLPVDPTTEPVEAVNHILSPGVRRVRPVHSRPELVELVGKEGDDLYAVLSDPGANLGSELTVYRAADTWAPMLDRARHLGADELCRRTGLPRSTAYHVLAGRPPSSETAALVAGVLDDIEPADRDEAQTVGGWHPCARSGCGRPVRGRRRWCTPGCRKAVERAQDRLMLHDVGGIRCRRCATVRFGDLRAPCPGCAERAAEVFVVVCPGCGTERVGNTTGPCAVCEKGAA